MEHKTIDLVRLFSAAFSALSVLGLAAARFGPWASAPDPAAETLLWISFMAFGMIYRLASSVGTILITQADAIAALERQLHSSRSDS